MSIVMEPVCEAQARPAAGQRQHNDLPCICFREPNHDGDHECDCGTHWASKGDRDDLDIVERVAIVGVRPGDVIVFESREDANDEQVDQLARRIQEVLGDQTLSIVINGKLGGILRREGDQLVETTSFSGHAKGRRTYLLGKERP
ncbi:hypothetical protein [Lentzea cavernae]|uniref:Uncharacterized protein n=1 Tax=Lentzea cavernae TaxID=2020703 RepID=A0ABQ3MXB5_9PSEU|nr:hypothetical protein [Lentzea cavernae]GHH57810.1 hypothetical protein GCM10017774_78130 [Lentzea cavernae]